MANRAATPAERQEIEARRIEADLRYNAALTAVDSAIPKPIELLPAVPPPDELSGKDRWQVPELTGPVGSGVKARFQRAVWHVLYPWIQQQRGFNRQLADHLSSDVQRERQSVAALQSLLQQSVAHARQIADFHASLITYLQQITPFVDTKDRSTLGEVSAVSERVGALEATQEEIRTTCAVLNQVSHTIRREVDRLATGGVAARDSAGAVTTSATQPLESWKYVGFEDCFRGSREQIRSQLSDYVADFAGTSAVLDIGCGRGELLDLLREAGITARGLDVNHEMVEICRSRGFDAVEGDALSFVESLDDASLGGIFAGQVVEHLQPDYLMRLLDAAYHKLRPGAPIVLETINPTCWAAFFSSYIRDPTHVRPVHPETLQYLLTASGFQKVAIRYRAPWPEADKLQRIVLPDSASPELRGIVDALNDNSERLNGKLFSFMDYAAVGARL